MRNCLFIFCTTRFGFAFVKFISELFRHAAVIFLCEFPLQNTEFHAGLPAALFTLNKVAEYSIALRMEQSVIQP